MILLECEIKRSIEEIGVNRRLERLDKKLELLTELRKLMDTTSAEKQAEKRERRASVTLQSKPEADRPRNDDGPTVTREEE